MSNLDLSFHWKRYLVSTGVSFLAGFTIVFLGEFDKLSIASLRDGTFIGVLFAATRGGVKLALESFVAWYQTKYGKKKT